MTVPPPEHLRISFTIDGVAQPLFGAELDVMVDGTTIDLESNRWVTALAPEVQITGTLVTAERSLHFGLPPRPLGLSCGSEDDEPEARVVTLEGELHQLQRATVSHVKLAQRGPSTLHAELTGALGAGATYSLVVEGRPTSARATVLASEGEARARTLLHRTLPDLDLLRAPLQQLRTGNEDDATLVAIWQPQCMLELAAREREHEAEARRNAELADAAAAAAERELRRTRPVPPPTAAMPLVAARAAHAIAAAQLGVRVTCAVEHGSAVVDQQVSVVLDIDVDESSGEDGALAPSFFAALRALPIELPVHGTWQTLAPSSVEGWFGNDAPELFEHRFAWRFATPTEVEIDWRASYADPDTEQIEALHFRGRAPCAGFTLQAPTAALLDAAFASAFGPETRARLQRDAGREIRQGKVSAYVAIVRVRDVGAPQ